MGQSSGSPHPSNEVKMNAEVRAKIRALGLRVGIVQGAIEKGKLVLSSIEDLDGDELKDYVNEILGE